MDARSIMKYSSKDVEQYIENPEQFAQAVSLLHLYMAFMMAIQTKLEKKMEEGKRGWDDPNWTDEQMKESLLKHLEKGEMVDVATIAMFIWNRGG